ncbi:MAG: transglycosylase SLT domain-containing protein [Saprospiraceae bacterium]|nr:transglycosylase SLT domain-containing protein [Saprospiraceae bacterium]
MAELNFLNYYKGDKAAFANKVMQISAELGIDPNWLMNTMYKESRVNPQAQNTKYLVGGKPATGLIQFVEKTANGLGTSVDALHKMDGIQQLDYVKKYFQPFRGRMKSYFDVYIAVFFPAAIGMPDNGVIATKSISASKVATSNPAIDLNKDGAITVAEFKEYLNGGIPAALRNAVAVTTNFVKKNKKPILLTILITGTALTGLIVYRKNIINKFN